VTIARLVGTVVRLGGRAEYRVETIVRVAPQHSDSAISGAIRAPMAAPPIATASDANWTGRRSQ
jgi:hypothetical protein